LIRQLVEDGEIFHWFGFFISVLSSLFEGMLQRKNLTTPPISAVIFNCECLEESQG